MQKDKIILRISIFSILFFFAWALCIAEGSGVSVRTNDSDKRATIMLNKDSYSISNGGIREATVKVKIEKGFFSKSQLTLDDKIKALKSKIRYYEFLKTYNIDSSQTYSLVYKEKLLKEALNELIPNVPVTFNNVKEDTKIKDFMASDTSLETILEYLDDAAGIYFEFNEVALVINKTP